MNATTPPNGNTQQNPQQPPASPAEHSKILQDLLSESERSFALLEKQAKTALRSRLISAEISDEDKAITIAMIGAELGVGPMTAMREIHLIPGKGQNSRPKPAISSQLKHALAIKRIPGFVINFLQADDKGCVVTAWRPSMGKEPPARFSWTVESSRKAGLLERFQSGAASNHEKFPSQMFLARAVSMAVDAVGPEATMGFPSVEQVQDEVHLERLASMPRAGDASGKDPVDVAQGVAPRATYLKSYAELDALLDDCISVSDVESFRENFKADRLALSKDQRETLIAKLTKKYVDAGGQLGRAAATKGAAEQAAAAPPATTEQASQSESEQAGAAKPARAPHRTSSEAKFDDAAREAELAGEIAALQTKDECIAWGEADTTKARRKKLSPGARGRVDKLLEARELALEEAEAAEGAAHDDGPPEPGSDG